MAKRKDINSDASDISSSEGECSDKDSETPTLAKKKMCFPTTSPIESDSDSEVVQPLLTGTNNRRTKRVKSDSEPEEGELTDSDSSDVSQDEFNDGYASDLMGDDEDRRNLASMTEKEREQELCRRADARDELKKRFEIEKRLRRGRKQELKKLKSSSNYEKYEKPSHSYLDLKERVLERKKSVEQNRGRSDKKFEAMNMLKTRREEKRERDEKEKEKQKAKQLRIDQESLRNETIDTEIVSRGNKTKLKASDVYSDDSGSSSDEYSVTKDRKNETVHVSSSSSSSSDSESENETRRSRLQCISSKDQLNSIRLSRQTLEKLVHLPFFAKVAVGSYVRITAGTHSNRPAYKICEILEVCETGKVYQLGNTRTNKGLRLKHGSLERIFRMEFVSNQEFTSSEFHKWHEICSEEGISLPTVEVFERKLKDIQEAMSYEFKEEDVEKIVKEKEKFKTTPYNFAVKKTQLLKERDMAQSMGDTKKVLELQEQLCQLEEQAAALDKRRNSGLIKINYINSMNRRKNVEEAEKAILAELRASKGQRADDPFTRRHTKPSMLIKAKNTEKKANDSNSIDTTNETTDKQENIIELKKVNPQKQGEDMYAAHDFEIKLDFDVPSSIPPVAAVAPIIRPTATTTTKPRSLNLEDYKRRKGFI